MNVMEAHGLRKTYESEGAPVRALRGVDMTIDAGRVRRRDGPFGLREVDAAQPRRRPRRCPPRARSSVAGESLAGMDESDLARMRRRHIGIVFQFFNLLEGMSVLENVTLPAVIAGTSRKPGREPGAGPAGPARAGRQGQERPRGALGRPAPAPGHRPRPGQRADAAAGRRADAGRSTPTAASRCSSCSGGCTPVARRSCSSPTTSTLAAPATRIVRMRDGRIRGRRGGRGRGPPLTRRSWPCRHEHSDNRQPARRGSGQRPAQHRGGRTAAHGRGQAARHRHLRPAGRPGRRRRASGRRSSTPTATPPPRSSGPRRGGLRRSPALVALGAAAERAPAAWSSCLPPLWAAWRRRRRRSSTRTPTAGRWRRAWSPWPASASPSPWPCFPSPPCTSCSGCPTAAAASAGPSSAAAICVGAGSGLALWARRPSLPLWPVAVEAVVGRSASVSWSRSAATPVPPGSSASGCSGSAGPPPSPWDAARGARLCASCSGLAHPAAARPRRLAGARSPSPSPWAAPAAWPAASTGSWPTPFPRRPHLRGGGRLPGGRGGPGRAPPARASGRCSPCR